MNVLFGSENFWPYVGGIEVLAAGLLPRLAERGHRFQVVTGQSLTGLPDRDHPGGIPITRLPFRAAIESCDPARIGAVRRAVDEIRLAFAPDLVHLFGLGSILAFLAPRPDASGKDLGPAFLLTLQNELPEVALREPDGLVRRTLRAAAWTTTCSRSMLDRVRRIEPAITTRSSAIVNGIDPPRVEPGILPTGPPVLLCLGRLTPQKGFDIALEAFRAVADHRSAPLLVIAGDGPDALSLRENAERLGISDRVEFRGMVPPDAVPRLLAGATVMVMPSRWEGLPVAAIEAAMMARPIVATRVDGIPEIVLDDRTGLLVEPEDPEGLAGAIRRLLDDPALALRLGRAGREHALRHFTLDAGAELYDVLYRRLDRSAATPA